MPRPNSARENNCWGNKEGAQGEQPPKGTAEGEEDESSCDDEGVSFASPSVGGRSPVSIRYMSSKGDLGTGGCRAGEKEGKRRRGDQVSIDRIKKFMAASGRSREKKKIKTDTDLNVAWDE